MLDTLQTPGSGEPLGVMLLNKSEVPKGSELKVDPTHELKSGDLERTKIQRHLQEMKFLEPRGAASMRTMGEECSSEPILITLGEKTVETDALLCGETPPACDASPSLGSDIHPNETNLERQVQPNLMNTPTLKREKSMTDTIERKKKRVKFNPQDDDEEILVETHVFEEVRSLDALIQDSDIVSSAPLASKLKRLLKNKSRSLEYDHGSDRNDFTTEKEEKGLDLKIESKMSKYETADTIDSDSHLENVIEKEGCNIQSPKYCEESVSNRNNLNDNDEKNVGLQFSNNSESLIGPREVIFDDGKHDTTDDLSNPNNEEDIAFIDDGEEQDDEELSKDDYGERDLKKDQYSIKTKEDKVVGEGEDEKSSPASLKREGTFTLEGSPPAKTMKPSTSLDNIIENKHLVREESKNTTTSGNLLHNSLSAVDNCAKVKLADSEPLRREKEKRCDESSAKHKHVSFVEKPCVVENTDVDLQNEVPWVKPRRDGVELKADSLASKRRAKVNVEKRISSCDDGEDLGADKTKTSSLRDSAKKTLINAWKSAMKGSLGHDNLGKVTPRTVEIRDVFEESDLKNSRNSPKRLCEEEHPISNLKNKVKQRDELKSCKANSREKSKSPTPGDSNSQSSKGAVEKTPKIRPFGNSNNGTNKSNVKSEEADAENSKKLVVGTVLPLRRDGTFTKCPSRWARPFDGDRARLEAELRKVSAEKERLCAEAAEARRQAEAEEAARKALRREQQQRLRRLREDEAARRELALADLRNRLEEEHREALQQHRTSQSRSCEAQLLRQEREHQEELRRAKQEARQEAERLRAEARKEATRPEAGSRCSPAATRDQERLVAELASLRDAKRRLEEALQRAQESEREHSTALRRAQSEHEGATAALVKQARHEQGKMMEELRARERASAQLEKQLAQMASKLQLLKEESRARSEEKAEGVRRPLSRSNSSPGHQVNKNNSNKQSNSKGNSKGGSSKQEQQQQRDDLTTEASADSMEGRVWGGEVARLREEVEQQRRTIRQLTLRMPMSSAVESGNRTRGGCPEVEGTNSPPRATLRPSPIREALTAARLNRVRETIDLVKQVTPTLFPAPTGNPENPQPKPGNPSTLASSSRKRSPSPQPSKTRPDLKRGRCSNRRAPSPASSTCSSSSIQSLPSLGEVHPEGLHNQAATGNVNTEPALTKATTPRPMKRNKKSPTKKKRSRRHGRRSSDRPVEAAATSVGAENQTVSGCDVADVCENRLPWPPGVEELAFLVVCRPEYLEQAFNTSRFMMPPHLLYLPEHFRL